jgi:hypothetical protein
MALSDDEQRTVDEMERMLAGDDPGFAARISLKHARRRRWIVSAALFVVGIGVLLAGLVTTAERAPVGVLISVAGLLIMIAAAVAVLSGAAGATDLSRGVRPRADGDARFGGCGDTDRSGVRWFRPLRSTVAAHPGRSADNPVATRANA